MLYYYYTRYLYKCITIINVLLLLLLFTYVLDSEGNKECILLLNSLLLLLYLRIDRYRYGIQCDNEIRISQDVVKQTILL